MVTPTSNVTGTDTANRCKNVNVTAEGYVEDYSYANYNLYLDTTPVNPALNVNNDTCGPTDTPIGAVIVQSVASDKRYAVSGTGTIPANSRAAGTYIVCTTANLTYLWDYVTLA